MLRRGSPRFSAVQGKLPRLLRCFDAVAQDLDDNDDDDDDYYYYY